jgi:hypothetical protein
MANEKTEADKRSIQNNEEKTRKPYVKPAFRFEPVFVTTALTCSKQESTEFGCRTNRKVS